ncbi:N-((2S)-2-amino-2-carboxyethyl)-L-glutamate dehydrogenase [Campylobacter majalis]|uniref:N-((2S)-2-amino-2-carboxyethyl)-L-glutamate dehydrogenase n=1 Tax=Campylobacter majalis TaxID=2790656 RepID=A0ABN7KAC7_9BACT|nr:hypothetical protein [Campylobacter majalis]CAD7289347.1 N-((2S)-2-amino-2-carboxyethyl)-L-glutamate dehydrogenase [Campylobacter majalis]
MRIRYISQEIQSRLLNIDDSIKTMQDMFECIKDDKYTMSGKNKNSHGCRLHMPNSSLFIAMPGYLGGCYNVSGIKWHGPNIKGSGFAETTYMLMLNDIATGYPLCIMSANLLTTYRTAATSIYAMQLLKKQEFLNVAIIGPGKINSLFLEGILRSNKEVKTIKVKGNTQKGVKNFIDYFAKKHDVKIYETKSLEECVKECDLISINTGFEYESVADMPILRSKWIKQNAIINAPSFFRMSDKFLINDAIKVADNFKMYQSYIDELGYPAYKSLSILGNQYADLVHNNKINEYEIVSISDILKNQKREILDKNGIVLFASGGMITQDIALAYDIFTKAKKQNLSTIIEF